MSIRNEAGAWMDGKGDHIPIKYISSLDKLKDKVVSRLVKKAEKLNKQIEEFKKEVEDGVEKYIATVEKEYQVQERTKQGNKTITDFANTLKVEFNVAKLLDFDEKLELAKDLIDKCIVEWSKGANRKLKVVIDQAFATDKRGFLDRDRILNLRNLEIKDKDWQKAMIIIGDSLIVVGKKSYIRFQKKVDGKWQTISLDIAKL
jgi:hypothetical protein